MEKRKERERKRQRMITKIHEKGSGQRKVNRSRCKGKENKVREEKKKGVEKCRRKRMEKERRDKVII